MLRMFRSCQIGSFACDLRQGRQARSDCQLLPLLLALSLCSHRRRPARAKNEAERPLRAQIIGCREATLRQISSAAAGPRAGEFRLGVIMKGKLPPEPKDDIFGGARLIQLATWLEEAKHMEHIRRANWVGIVGSNRSRHGVAREAYANGREFHWQYVFSMRDEDTDRLPRVCELLCAGG